MSERLTGRVKMFDYDKGYGFLAYEGGKDVFFHASSLPEKGPRTIRKGQLVEFSLEQGSNGMQAVNILPVKQEG